MNALISSPKFQAELPGWLARGVICALNSGYFALIADFRSAPEIVGMVVGVMVWAGIFAAVCAWFSPASWFHRYRLREALHWAVWLKVGLTVAGWGLVVLSHGTGAHGWSEVGMFGTLDTITGMAALWLVSCVAGMKDSGGIPALDSSGWTALTTIVDGLFIAVVIVAMAMVVVAWWRVLRLMGWNGRISPVPKTE